MMAGGDVEEGSSLLMMAGGDVDDDVSLLMAVGDVLTTST